MVKSKRTRKVAVVIAAFNEEKSIREVVKSIPRQLPRQLGSVKVIVVDDGSTDETFAEAKASGAFVLHHLINLGQGAALKTAFDYCVNQKYDIVVTFDADGQHAASEIARLVETLIKGKYDVVLGSRFLSTRPKDIPGFRKFVLKVGVIFTRILSRVKVSDTHNGFRAFRREALQKINLVQDRMEHASEILDQIGRHRLRFTEVPVTITYSDYSKQKGQQNSNALRIAGKMFMHKIMK